MEQLAYPSNLWPCMTHRHPCLCGRQVRLFLRFFRNKRESALRVLENEFEDAKNDRCVASSHSHERYSGPSCGV